jgi:LPXTG-motif cell wall-anchored protein
MMKNKKIIWLNLMTLFVAIITLFSFGNRGYAAETNTATVTTEYIDYSSLNATEQGGIIKGEPSGTIKHDTEAFSLVYKKVENKNNITSPSSSVTPMNNTNPTSKNTGFLPKAGEQSDTFLYIFGVLIIAIAGFVLYKWKRAKHILLLIVAVGSLGWLKNVSAETLASLPSKKTVEYSFGSEYYEAIPSISGYEYVGYLHNYSDNTKPIENGTVTVQFVDEADKEISPSEILTGVVGSDYIASSKEIDGYTLLSSPNNVNGKFTLSPQTVKYVYKEANKNGTVTVQFVDESDKEIAPSKILTGLVGSDYTTSSEEIDGYTLLNSPNNEKGKYTLSPQTVKYVYKEVDQSATITVKFVDESGNPFVIPDFTAMKNGSFVPLYPNLEQYYTVFDYDGQTYNQKQVVNDVSISTKIGEKYSLPEQVKFSIKDDKGNDVKELMSLNEDYSSSGPMYWYSKDTPNNVSGTVKDKEVVVTYVISCYSVQTPVP